MGEHEKTTQIWTKIVDLEDKNGRPAAKNARKMNSKAN